MRLDLNTTSTAIEFGGRFGGSILKMLEGSVVARRISLWLWISILHHTCVIKGWAIKIRDLNWDHCLKLLCMMPQRRVHPWARGLNCIEIYCDVIRLILLHLALSTYLIDLWDIPRLWRLLNELSPILLTWLFGHQCCWGSQCLLVVVLLWIDQGSINFSVA